VCRPSERFAFLRWIAQRLDEFEAYAKSCGLSDLTLTPLHDVGQKLEAIVGQEWEQRKLSFSELRAVRARARIAGGSGPYRPHSASIDAGSDQDWTTDRRRCRRPNRQRGISLGIRQIRSRDRSDRSLGRGRQQQDPGAHEASGSRHDATARNERVGTPWRRYYRAKHSCPTRCRESPTAARWQPPALQTARAGASRRGIARSQRQTVLDVDDLARRFHEQPQIIEQLNRLVADIRRTTIDGTLDALCSKIEEWLLVRVAYLGSEFDPSERDPIGFRAARIKETFDAFLPGGWRAVASPQNASDRATASNTGVRRGEEVEIIAD